MPTYQRGDYVKVEFQDETTVIGEWMWVRVHRCDDEKQLIFGTLGNQLVTTTEVRSSSGQNWLSATPRFESIRRLLISHRRTEGRRQPAQNSTLSWLSVKWRSDVLPK